MTRVWLLCLLLCACGPGALQLQAAAANGMAVAVNAMVTVLETQYQRDLDAVVDNATSAEEAEVMLRAVRADWLDVWLAIEAYAAAHDAWATALEQGGAVDVLQLAVSYCTLRSVLLERDIELPDVGCG